MFGYAGPLRVGRALLAWAWWLPPASSSASCPATFNLEGYGPVSLVLAGWSEGQLVDVLGDQIVARMGGRAYFADTCTAGAYDRHQYMALSLLGKQLRYTTDVSGAGCGCNAAFYLASMRQNADPGSCGEFYCDANSVCGVYCAEIDLQEANKHAFHTTLHSSHDGSGKGGGFGGYGGKDWTAAQYSPGSSCIDTTKPFEVTVSFPVDAAGQLQAMETKLTQVGHSCSVSARVDSYKDMQELSAALAAGMTPVLSYWSADDMLWLDGKGDSNGVCAEDLKHCSATAAFRGFSVSDIGAPAPEATFRVAEATFGEGQSAEKQAEEQAEQEALVAEIWRQEQAEELLRAKRAEQDAPVIVPTLAPASQRAKNKEGFFDVFGRWFNFMNLYDAGNTKHQAGRAHWAARIALAAGSASVASIVAAVWIARRRRAYRDMMLLDGDEPGEHAAAPP